MRTDLTKLSQILVPEPNEAVPVARREKGIRNVNDRQMTRPVGRVLEVDSLPAAKLAVTGIPNGYVAL
jgi:hypothetical protein